MAASPADGPGVPIRRLEPDDAPEYLELRLQMLRAHPEAFTSSYAEERAKPLSWTRERLTPRESPARFVLGALSPDGRIVGSVGLMAEERDKQRHKATLFGMFTAQQARGRGVGRALLAECLRLATHVPGLEQVNLTVTEGNAAEALYRAFGFRRFGLEERAIRVGEAYFGKVHMVHFLGPDSGRAPTLQ